MTGYFVISTGRCGSTLLSELLSNHPSVLSISEFFSVYGGAPQFGEAEVSDLEFRAKLEQCDRDLLEVGKRATIPEIVSPNWNSRSNVHGLMLVMLPQLTATPEDLLREIRNALTTGRRASESEHVVRLFEWLRLRLDRQVWVERSGGSIEYVDHIMASWASSALIHLVRDGRECAHSMSQHPMFQVRLARILARNAAMPIRSCLESAIPVDRFGAYWSALMLRTEKTLVDSPLRRHLVITYDELQTSHANTLTTVARFMGLPQLHDCRWIQNGFSKIRASPPRWQTLGASVRKALERSCRPGMHAVERILARRNGMR